MARNTPTDPRRARMLELCEELQDRTNALRDYTQAPDDVWLAKGELQHISILVSDIEALLDEIRRYDTGEI